MAEDIPCCANCAFFIPNERIPLNREQLPEGFGECRRRAPQGMTLWMQTSPQVEKVIYKAFPFAPVPPVDWCGEHMHAHERKQEPSTDG